MHMKKGPMFLSLSKSALHHTALDFFIKSAVTAVQKAVTIKYSGGKRCIQKIKEESNRFKNGRDKEKKNNRKYKNYIPPPYSQKTPPQTAEGSTGHFTPYSAGDHTCTGTASAGVTGTEKKKHSAGRAGQHHIRHE